MDSLAHLSPERAAERVQMMFTMALSAIAMQVKRRSLGIGSPAVTFDEYIDRVVVVAVAALSAP